MIFLGTYLLTFIEGILTFISPCILPMLPIYFIHLAGTYEKPDNKESFQPVHSKKRMINNSIGFVVGFTIVFVLLGATVTTLGHFLSTNKILFQKISGIIMILFGFNFMGLIKINFINKEKRFHMKALESNFFDSLLFGMAFSFGWTPCLGAFLGSALLLASSSKTIFQGILLLLLYSLGLGIPFIITAIVFEKARTALKQLQKYSKTISITSGVLLIIAGLLVFFDKLKYLN